MPLPPGIELAPALTVVGEEDRARGAEAARPGAGPRRRHARAHPPGGRHPGRGARPARAWGLDDEAREALRMRSLELCGDAAPARGGAARGGGRRGRRRRGAGAGERRVISAEATQLDARVAALPAEIRSALDFGGPLPPAPVLGEPVLGEPVAPIDVARGARRGDRRLTWPSRGRCATSGSWTRSCAAAIGAVPGGAGAAIARPCETLGDYAGGVLHVAAAWLTGARRRAGAGRRSKRDRAQACRAPLAARRGRCSRSPPTPAAGSPRARSSSGCAPLVRTPTRSSSRRRCCGSRPTAATPRSPPRMTFPAAPGRSCAARSAARRCPTTGPRRSRPARAVSRR